MRYLRISVTLTAALLCVGACSPGQSEPQTKGEDAVKEKSDKTTRWIIRPGQVGDIKLGAPLPKKLSGQDKQKLAERYFAQYVADAQPLEGFRLTAPPVTIALAEGPFAAHVKEHGVVKPPVDALREEAAEHARGGATVSAILVTESGPVTEAGIGVGSSLKDLKGAYGEVSLLPVPETFGDDRCTVTTKELPGVRFIFPSCKKARDGASVIRVDLWESS